jgi:hypothetical protein
MKGPHMIRTTLLAMALCASTIAATPPGTGTSMPPEQPPAAAPPPLAPAPATTGAPTASPSPDPAMLARAKAEFAQLQSGTVDRATLTVEMSTALTDDKLATLKSAIGSLGAPVSFEQQRSGTQGGVRYTVYLVAFANGAKLDFIFAVDGQGKIAGMRLMPNQ